MSSETTKPKCEDCKHYEGDGALSECHRYAPRWSPRFAVATTKETILKNLKNGWPEVSKDSFCGDFESNE